MTYFLSFFLPSVSNLWFYDFEECVSGPYLRHPNWLSSFCNTVHTFSGYFHNIWHNLSRKRRLINRHFTSQDANDWGLVKQARFVGQVMSAQNTLPHPRDTTKVMPTRKRVNSALRTRRCLAIIPTQRLIWEIHINPTQCWKIDFVKRSILATFKHSSDLKMSDKYLRFRTLRWNPKVWPLKWKLSMSTF